MKAYHHVAICRIGKTSDDNKRNAHSRNRANKQARADWNNTPTYPASNFRSQSNFPYTTCNGKKNRSFDNKGQPIIYKAG